MPGWGFDFTGMILDDLFPEKLEGFPLLVRRELGEEGW
jgi:hypothetical protein